MSSTTPIVAETDLVVNSLTPQQRLVWQLVRQSPLQVIPTEYLAQAWGEHATSLDDWRGSVYALVKRMNKRLARHGLALRGVSNSGPRGGGGGYRLIRLNESERAA